MEKISLQLAFTILLFLTGNQQANAMDQASARIVPVRHALVPLKNGSQATVETAFNTHQTVIAAIDNNGGFAIGELVRNCKDETSVISQEAGELLHRYGLVNQEYRPYRHLINIILSMAKGHGENMRIVNPIDYKAIDPE